MGLDITFNTQLNNNKKKVWAFELTTRKYKKLMKARDAAFRKFGSDSKEADAAHEKFIAEANNMRAKADAINKKNGYHELYFRKCPRVLVSALEQKEIEDGLTENFLRDKCNAMEPDLDSRVFEGTILLKNLKEAFKKSNLRKNQGFTGFFWGTDSMWKEKEILDEYNNFIKELEEAGLNSDDTVIEYCFSW